MSRSSPAGFALAILIALSLPAHVDAQLGGLIKKKVKEAIKPPEKTTPAPASGAPAPAQAAQPQSTSRHSFPRVPNARALLLTDEMIARMTRGLDAEQVMVAALEKEIARYPTPEQYEACQVRFAGTPEGKKVMDISNYVKAGMSPDQIQKGMMRMSAESDSAFKRACPLDPKTWSDYNRSEKLKEIRDKAARQSGGTDTLVGMDENDFGEMIERVLKYCELKKTMDVTPKAAGIRSPGVGKDIYWVYTESELKTLQKLDCVTFRKKYANLLGAYT
jgi:hypothetical protein